MDRPHRARLCLGAALAALTLTVAPAAFAQAVPPKFAAMDVFKLESAHDPQLSPDGAQIAYVRRAADVMTDRYRSSIWVIDARTGEQRALVAGAASASAPRWSPDGRRLLYSAGPELRVLDLATRADWSLGKLGGGARGAIWSPDGASIAYLRFVDAKPPSFATPPAPPPGAEWGPPAKIYDRLDVHADGAGFLKPGATQVFILPVEGGTERQVTQGTVSYGDIAWLGQGALVASANANPDADLDPRESDLFRIDLASGQAVALTTRKGPDAQPVVSPDGRRIAYVGYDDRKVSWQTNQLYVMNADGSGARSLTAGLDRSLSSPTFTPDGAAILATAMSEGRIELLRITLDGKITTLASDLNEGAGGRPYVGGSYSLAKRKDGGLSIAYTQGRADRPSDIALMTSGAAAKRLTDLNQDALGGVAMGQVRKLPVKSSADGRAIDAWMLLPPDYQPGKRYPTILEIHGGPAIMYGPTFAAELQRFAAEGFVVLFANQRGSLGYGEAFALTIDRTYPGKDDLADLMSVVDAAVAAEVADPQRLFVTGGSAGGAMTAWIVGNTDRFAAAVVVNPVINWVSTMLAGDTAAHVARHQIRAMPWDDLDLFWKLSPLSRAGHVKTPTMVMVGEEDWRTPPAEAEQFYTALKLRGVDSALARIPGSGHNIGARPTQFIAKTDNIIGWFRAHDPARAQQGAAKP